MNNACQPQKTKPKRSAFELLGIILLSLFGLCVAILAGMIAWLHMFPDLVARELRPSQPRQVISDLRLAIFSYQVDYNHYPIPKAVSHNNDMTLRSSGTLLPALLGRASELNPRGIKFFEAPFDSDSKHGLWQDGNEWVLRDRWGEPYYIILDTNKDDQVPNPEFGASTTDPKQAEFDQKFPPPKLLPLGVAIYSSGPDRDPKTWQDNVCSWRSH